MPFIPPFGVAPGVNTLRKAGSTKLKKDVTLTGGANISLTQVGQDIEIIGSAGGSGSMTTIKENDVQVGGADIVTLDFLGADFNLTESPNTEIQIVIEDSGIDHDQTTNFLTTEHYLQSAIVATGAINVGSITSGFGTINTGSSTITTTGVITAGGLTIGLAVINEAELEILDGATVTTTELNIIDGGTSATATTLADADRVVVNDAGVMKQVALTDFETYFESALDTLPNVTTVGTIGTGTWQGDVIDHERGGIETNISAITTGGILRGASSGVMSILTVGSDGLVLTAQADGSVAWEAVAGSGDVTGDTASIDKEFVRFNSTTGKVIESPRTDLSTTTATLSDNADLTFYDAVNDGNPVFSYGSSATNDLAITVSYGTGAQTIDFVEFKTTSSSASADFGEFRFSVDETLVATIDDGGVEIRASGSLSFGAVDILTDSAGTTTLSNIDVIDTTTGAAIEADIVHDNLQSIPANDHIDHSGVTITAGVGLSGGGTIEATRTLTVDLNELGTETTIDAGVDFIAMVDATDSGSQKILAEDIPVGYDTETAMASGDFVIMVDITDNNAGKITFANFEGDLAHNNLIAGTIVSHDTTATGAELTELTDASETTLHSHAAGGGDVTGDSASADKELVRFNGTTGKVIESPVTDLATTTATLSDNADLTLFDAVNDGSPVFSLGSSATEKLQITASYVSAGVELEFVEFDTPTGSATADRGEYRFKVDAALIATIDDGGIELADAKSYFIDTSNVLSETALGSTVVGSSLTSVGALGGGTIASGFGAIDNGASNITTTGTAALGNITLGTDGTISSLVLTEKASIALDPAGGADGDYSGITIAATAGATVAFGEMVYLQASDSRWELTDADAVGTAGTVLVGICVLAAAGDGSAITILLQGTIKADAAFPALTIGAPVYIGVTPGAIQVAAPTGADDVVRVAGFALTADEIYFNPEGGHITHTG